MSARDTVTFYLHPKLRRQAENGNQNFIAKVSEVLEGAGLKVAFDSMIRQRGCVRWRAWGEASF